jgi:GTP-binding protein LepA
MDQAFIRNFCIIAHIDHGKSTLADRLLETTNTVERRQMRDQLLDTMDLERERGITIKLQPVRMEYDGLTLDLIDTPGHVDFTYEVSRSLAAVEGAILLVDASQGVQAQTLANLYLAIEQGVTVVPVVNKIDLPNADVPKTTAELIKLLGCQESEIIKTSGKSGQGVDDLLMAIRSLPAPVGNRTASLRALIFDSAFDEFRGVIAFIRVVDGQIATGQKIKLAAAQAEVEVQEVGFFKPARLAKPELTAGEIGYVITGLKDVRQCRVGDTIMLAGDTTSAVLPGYRDVKPMVYVGVFPKEGSEYAKLREALGRLQLSDAALIFEPESSTALGFGFRVGLLGLLHLEIMQERLYREAGLAVVITVPSVAYQVIYNDKTEGIIKNPTEFPDPSRINIIKEPWVSLDIITPRNYLGTIMQLVAENRGEYLTTEYLEDRAIIHYRLPLAAILVDFYDKLKSVSAGYASMNYTLDDYRAADVVRMDIMVADEPVESLATIVYRDEAFQRGKAVVNTLKESLPKQQFMLKIQAAVGGKIVAAERLSALRKDVTAGLYGGDVTRKQKLLKKQKAGKKRMAEHGKGKVEIPADTYLKVLRKI